MKQIVYVAVFALSLLHGSMVYARPSIPEPGVCYYFKGQKLQRQRPCSIQYGYGAGAHYVTLIWSDGSETSIYKVNYCPKQNYNNEGFCEYSVNDKPAKRLHLSSFLSLSSEPLSEEDRAGDCFEIKASKETFCHSLGH